MDDSGVPQCCCLPAPAGTLTAVLISPQGIFQNAESLLEFIG